jgi:hypothetical protein
MKPQTISDYLLKCRQLNTHGGCPDGILARNILLKALEPLGAKLTVVPRRPGVKDSIVHPAIFVDMSPPEDQFLEVLQQGGVIMDHHVTVKHLFEQYADQFPDQLLWGENDLAQSGAVLAYEACASLVRNSTDNLERAMKRASYLVGLGDTWQKDHPDFELARAFANLIDLIGNDYEGLLEETELAEKLWASKKKEFARSAEKALWRDVLDKRVAFINTLKTSDVAELLRAKGANIIVGFAEIYDPERQVEWIGFSMRSDGSWDCSAFAKKYGGGGHVPAAGFGQERDEVMVGRGNTIDWFCKHLYAHNYAEWASLKP